MTEAERREARLPKWAQDELQRLRREVKLEKLRNTELRGAVGDTNIHVQNYGGDDQPIPKGASVRFRLGDDRWDEQITCRIEHGALVLHGGRSLLIQPQVSNSVIVSVGRR